MKLELGSVFVEPTRPDLVREKGGLVSNKQFTRLWMSGQD